MLQKISKDIISAARIFFENRPLLKQRVVRFLNRYPKLKSRIKRGMQESYNNTSSLDLFVNGSVSEDNCKIVEREGSLSIKKRGIHEDKKSVLESWFY
ncbi:hypothetical protein ABI309_02220 [Citrobacter youngae]|uniref:hypothetical protein n=1 Tax=Citrobacter youngae TaxID=133448 RepID=UPI000E2F237F|nr:hypothetical protein [Citrobacter youngae]MCO4163215.1 hypothetical protein [Citrobacter youngae]